MRGLPGKQQAGTDLGMGQIWNDPWSAWPLWPFMFWSSSRTISIFNATVTDLGAHCPLKLRFDAARIIAGWPVESAESHAWCHLALGTPAARSFEARILTGLTVEKTSSACKGNQWEPLPTWKDQRWWESTFAFMSGNLKWSIYIYIYVCVSRRWT